MKAALATLATLLGLALPVWSRFAPNLILLSVDTTRMDHLGHGGHPLPASVHMDRLARQSYGFTAAQSVIPLTGPAHGTMLTGLLPHAHGAIRNCNRIRKDIPTLPEILRGQLYQTAAFISGWTLRKNRCGLDRGFELYDQEMTDHYGPINSQRPANVVTGRALEWLESRRSRPFFLLLHYYDPHAPYTARRAWSEDFHRSYWGRRRDKKPKLTRKLAVYDSEIAFMDVQIGRFLGALDRSGLLQTSWLVVLSDHGEAFGEHGYHRHGRRVHQPALHVPFLIRPPGGLARSRLIDEIVSTVDLMPTLLELLDLDPVLTQGRSLVPLFQGAPLNSTSPVHFETTTWWSLSRKKLPSRLGMFLDPLKLVLNLRDKSFSVYDLARDPGERHNIAETRPELQRYHHELLDWWRSSRRPVKDP